MDKNKKTAAPPTTTTTTKKTTTTAALGGDTAVLAAKQLVAKRLQADAQKRAVFEAICALVDPVSEEVLLRNVRSRRYFGNPVVDWSLEYTALNAL